MTAFDSFLNFIIPILVVIGMLWILYKPFSKPINALGNWIKRLIKGEEEIAEEIEGSSYNIPIIKQNLDFE